MLVRVKISGVSRLALKESILWVAATRETRPLFAATTVHTQQRFQNKNHPSNYHFHTKKQNHKSAPHEGHYCSNKQSPRDLNKNSNDIHARHSSITVTGDQWSTQSDIVAPHVWAVGRWIHVGDWSDTTVRLDHSCRMSSPIHTRYITHTHIYTHIYIYLYI